MGGIRGILQLSHMIKLSTFQTIFLVGAGILILATVYRALVFRRLVHVGVGLAQSAVPFSATPADPTSRILIIGDSTAVGTGATDSRLSIAGRISADFPHATIVNAGHNGMRGYQLLRALDAYEGRHFDRMIIQIGANDVVRFTSWSNFTTDISAALTKATHISPRVYLFTSGNIGTAPIFPWPLRLVYESRTRHARALLSRLTAEHGVTYIDLFRERAVDPFAADPQRYYGADSFHPSNDGYGVWYERVGAALRVDTD